jgi:DNA-binding NtrC family response regulator
LVAHFIEKFPDHSGQLAKGISSKAVDALCHYGWPGNIRELENMVERLLVLSESEIVGLYELPPELRGADSRSLSTEPLEMTFREAVGRFESALLLQALNESSWNKSVAAESLGMKRTTLLDMIRRKRLGDDGPRSFKEE